MAALCYPTTWMFTLMVCGTLLQVQPVTCVRATTANDPNGESNPLDTAEEEVNTELLELIASSMIHALPEITDLLTDIAGQLHKNATTDAAAATDLPSIIVQKLEDVKNLQVSQNALVENGTAVETPIHLEMVRLINDQKEAQGRFHQQLLDHTAQQTKLLEDVSTSLQHVVRLLEDQVARQGQIIDAIDSSLTPTDDDDVLELPHTCLSQHVSGRLTILPQNHALGSVPVVCDMHTDGGGWIVFQRRFNGSVNFDRAWDDYETGFGSLDGEFWLGLDKLHVITSRGRWELRVDLESFSGDRMHALYDNFRIGDAESFYRLDLGSYSGPGYPAQDYDAWRSGAHDINGMAFTTKDRDHDLIDYRNCALIKRSGWWHRSCTIGNLNGLYLEESAVDDTSMSWWNFKRTYEALKGSELKIRLI